MEIVKYSLNLPNIMDGEDKTPPFKNRLRQNYKHIRKWAKRTETIAFRLYDRDLKDYPSISRSKKMERKFDVQLDYPFLISHALKLLTKEGIIFFSTNSRKFSLDQSQFESCVIEEITHQTIPLDIRNKKIHRSWKVQHAS